MIFGWLVKQNLQGVVVEPDFESLERQLKAEVSKGVKEELYQLV